jgi:hypothetical protein
MRGAKRPVTIGAMQDDNGRAPFIQEHLAAGRNVYIQTCTRATKLSRKHAEAKGAGNSIYLQRGKHWDCIDYCKISAR